MERKNTVEYRIDESLHQEYEAIKTRFLAKDHILAIKECESKIFGLPDEEKLEVCGISGCRPLLYFADTYDQNAPGDHRIAGRHIPVQTSTGRSSVILVRSDYPTDYPPSFVCACKVCILFHELGHADDFYEGYNFKHTKMEYDPEAGEKYADAFAKERLKRIRCQKIVEGKESPATLWDWYSQVRYIGSFVG
jgi:hypothetical protein